MNQYFSDLQPNHLSAFSVNRLKNGFNPFISNLLLRKLTPEQSGSATSQALSMNTHSYLNQLFARNPSTLSFGQLSSPSKNSLQTSATLSHSTSNGLVSSSSNNSNGKSRFSVSISDSLISN